MNAISYLRALTVFAGALLLGSGLGRPAWAQAERPPNVVFILADDLGWADLPVYGNTFHETPNIDRLAAQGVRFTDAYAAAPVCSPTRASIQSGQYPARVGITDFIPGHWRPYEKVTVPTNRHQHLPLDITTMGEALQEAGYATGYFGKWHLGGVQAGLGPEDQGYDEAVVYQGWGHFELGDKLVPPQDVQPDDYLTDVLAEETVAFMEAHQDEPFFVTLAHFAVHIPLEAQDSLIAKYEAKPKPDPASSAGQAVGPGNPIYAAMIEHVDESVGRVLDALDSLDLAENMVVVFYSDNGGLVERFDKADGVVVSTNAPLRDEKGSLYEGGIREPLIVRWPGTVEPGQTSEALMTSPDLFPTFAEIAGAALPEGTSDRRHQPRAGFGRGHAGYEPGDLLALSALPSLSPGGRDPRGRLQADRVLRRRTSGAVQPGRRHRRGEQPSRGDAGESARSTSQTRSVAARTSGPRCPRPTPTSTWPGAASGARIRIGSRRVGDCKVQIEKCKVQNVV